MANGAIFFSAMLVASLLLDGAIRPRLARWRRWPGLVLHLLVMTGLFGLFLAGSGTVLVAAALTTALMVLFTVASNAKYAMLGEPLIFSDLALMVAICRHPRFYFTAIPIVQRWMMGICAAAALLVLALLFTSSPIPHLVGIALLLLAAGTSVFLLRCPWFERIARTPALDTDIARYGMAATLLLYWLRWRESVDPPTRPVLNPAISQPLRIVIVQCESFADPVELTGDQKRALPGLAAARTMAWQYGALEVSGFGAYTMRTEYGVLFGRSETALGFRRYDPFLTAYGDATHALSAQLKGAGYHCSFLHPHDLHFYGRDKLMPAIGFDRLIGEEHFGPISSGDGYYIDDRTLGTAISDLADEARGPALIYAVTMENHGPWRTDEISGPSGRLDAYLRHLYSSDLMLSDLAERLSAKGDPALLVFFGDHRPSIPGAILPGGARHTPYVILRFDETGCIVRGDNSRVDLTPADLHHAILSCVVTPLAED